MPVQSAGILPRSGPGFDIQGPKFEPGDLPSLHIRQFEIIADDRQSFDLIFSREAAPADGSNAEIIRGGRERLASLPRAATHPEQVEYGIVNHMDCGQRCNV